MNFKGDGLVVRVMNYINLIKYIEDENIALNNNYYYYAFNYRQKDFINMITDGIKSPILLRKNSEGNNGNFYVSLSKKERCEYSIYDKLNNNPMFVINNNIKTIQTRNFIKNGHYPLCFINSPLPFRESEYDNEYQVFLKVPSKNILAIEYNLFNNCRLNNNDYFREQLIILKQMIIDLNGKNIHIPIIDASTSTKINKEKVLLLKM